MTAAVDLSWEALDWLARLPLLGAYELSLLTGVNERQAAAQLSELSQAGWLESMRPSSPEFEPDLLYALSRDGVQGLATALGLPAHDLAAILPAARAELAQRLARIEITVGVNRFAAEVVAAVRGEEDLALEDLRALPARRPASAWWPGEAEAFACLRVASAYAPFFIAWDRAGAPFFHRRNRVSSWYAFRDGEQPWGREGMPSILVLCAGETESAQWERAVLASADRRRSQPLPVLLAEIDAVFSADPLEAVWRRAGGSVESPLAELLAWRWAMPAETAKPHFVLPLRALELLSAPPGKDGSLRVADRRLPATIGATEKRLIEWLGFHPLLAADELGLLIRAGSARSPLAGLVAKGLVDCVEKQTEEGSSVEPRYFLTAEGLKLLALRDGVPPRRYARHSAVAASVPGWRGAGRLQTLLRQFEHTVGVNRFVVRLIDHARRHGLQVVRWLSASEAAQRFTTEATTHWLRPDAVVDVQWQGRLRRLYIEWDRGTMRWPEMRAKFRLYAAFYAAHEEAGASGSTLLETLIVTTSSTREAAIWRELETEVAAAFRPPDRFFTSLASLVDRFGPFGRVWHDGPSKPTRSLWQ